MSDTLLICDRCGEVCYRLPDSAVDYCDECGVVEGNTHEVSV